MKQTLKVSVMALVAMFAFSTVADAQFGLGKLVNKARKSVGLQTKQEKRQDSIQTAIQSITPTIPQPVPLRLIRRHPVRRAAVAVRPWTSTSTVVA